jgi:hypothetical protein
MMKIQILQRGGYKYHETLEAAIRFYASQLMTTRMSNTLTVRVEVRATKLTDGNLATVAIATNGSRPTKTFKIILDRERSLSDQVGDLAHEMAHVAQAATGRYQLRRWKSDLKVHARWEGKELGLLDDQPYWTRPWEVEARAKEVELVPLFWKEHRPHRPRPIGIAHVQPSA